MEQRCNINEEDVKKESLEQHQIFHSPLETEDGKVAIKFEKFNEIIEEFTEVKNQIRQAAFKDEKKGEQILTKVRNLEKLMDEDFLDLVE